MLSLFLFRAGAGVDSIVVVAADAGRAADLLMAAMAEHNRPAAEYFLMENTEPTRSWLTAEGVTATWLLDN